MIETPKRGWLPFDPARYAKAIGTLVVTGLSGFLTANADGHVTQNEWVWIALMALASTGIVAAVPNKP